ncbi:hypothetical protein ACIQVN_06220 [Streptomyces cyaneofuscatus]
MPNGRPPVAPPRIASFCGRAAIWAPDGALLAEADDRTPMAVTAEVALDS